MPVDEKTVEISRVQKRNKDGRSTLPAESGPRQLRPELREVDQLVTDGGQPVPMTLTYTVKTGDKKRRDERSKRRYLNWESADGQNYSLRIREKANFLPDAIAILPWLAMRELALGSDISPFFQALDFRVTDSAGKVIQAPLSSDIKKPEGAEIAGALRDIRSTMRTLSADLEASIRDVQVKSSEGIESARSSTVQELEARLAQEISLRVQAEQRLVERIRTRDGEFERQLQALDARLGAIQAWEEKLRAWEEKLGTPKEGPLFAAYLEEATVPSGEAGTSGMGHSPEEHPSSDS